MLKNTRFLRNLDKITSKKLTVFPKFDKDFPRQKTIYTQSTYRVVDVKSEGIIMIEKLESNGSITLKVTSGTGASRKLNINSYRVANTRLPAMSLAILDKDDKFLGEVILNTLDITVLLSKIGDLI